MIDFGIERFFEFLKDHKDIAPWVAVIALLVVVFLLKERRKLRDAQRVASNQTLTEPREPQVPKERPDMIGVVVKPQTEGLQLRTQNRFKVGDVVSIPTNRPKDIIVRDVGAVSWERSSMDQYLGRRATVIDCTATNHGLEIVKLDVDQGANRWAALWLQPKDNE